MRVFVTVGSMLPFDRLVRMVDKWAAEHPDVEIVAQVGNGDFRPTSMQFVDMMAPQEYRRQCAESDVILSHAGMGTVITAAELGRPLVALPRRPELGEVTSDHQLATARWLAGRPGITVIETEAELESAMQAALNGAAVAMVASPDRDRLIAHVRNFVFKVLAKS